MGRPARPSAERVAVLEAAARVQRRTGLRAADPVAAVVASETVTALKAFVAEGGDPVLAAAGDFRRRTCPSPYDTLATDPDIDSVDLFVSERVHRLRARSGRGLTGLEDEKECREVWSMIEAQLADRFLRALRLARNY